MSYYRKKAEKQGPCFLCGDMALARHRLWDAIDEQLRWYTKRELAYEFGLSLKEIAWIIRAYRYARKHHTPLPGRKGWRDVT